MVKEITGDLVRDGHGFIAHQANYLGVMGGGVAYAIQRDLLTPEAFAEYQRLCWENGPELLGKNQYLPARNGSTVVNMFCQNDYGDEQGSLTNYRAMRMCFLALREEAEATGTPIFIPGRIGCGIAGGRWPLVKQIIHATLGDARVPVTLVYLGQMDGGATPEREASE